MDRALRGRLSPPPGVGEPGRVRAAAVGAEGRRPGRRHEADHKFLWDVEHHGLLLSKKGFLLLASALGEGDAARLQALLGGDFRGQVYEDPKQTRVAARFASVLRQEDAGRPPQLVDAGGFVEQLLAFRRSFGPAPPRVKLDLIKLGPVDRKQWDGPWQGSAQLRMWGKEPGDHPAEVTLLLDYRLSRPTEENLRRAWLHSASLVQSRVARAPRFLMRDGTRESGIRTEGLYNNWDWTVTRKLATTDGVYVADYDRDSNVDLYFYRSGLGNALWRNHGAGFFEDVTTRSGTGGGKRSTFAAAWLDVNNDDWPDLYIINEFGVGVLLLNQRDGTFREQGLNAGAGDWGSMGLVAGDVDNDGNVDLYVANMYSKAGKRVIGNLRADAYPPDLMALLRRFVTGSQLYLNRGNLKFEPAGDAYQVSAVGWSYGPTLVDLDNDGFLDIYATCGHMSQNRLEPDG